jgi:hypothetical protein
MMQHLGSLSTWEWVNLCADSMSVGVTISTALSKPLAAFVTHMEYQGCRASTRRGLAD